MQLNITSLNAKIIIEILITFAKPIILLQTNLLLPIHQQCTSQILHTTINKHSKNIKNLYTTTRSNKSITTHQSTKETITQSYKLNYTRPKHLNLFQPLRHQNNIWSASELSKYCPLYPGIPANISSSTPTNLKSSSSFNIISTKISTHTSFNQRIKIHQPPSIPTNSNLEGFQSDDYSYSNSSPIPTLSLNSLELNTPEDIMRCLTTKNPKDEDTT